MWFHMHQDSGVMEPGKGMPRKLDEPHDIIDARDPTARQTLISGAVEGHVLVKNTKSTLPLRSPKLLSVFGYSAKSPDVFAPTKGINEASTFQWKYGAEVISGEEIWSGFRGKHFHPQFSVMGMNGTMIHGGGSGATTPVSFLSPFEALKLRSHMDNVGILHDFESRKPVVHPGSDACIVFGNAWASESYDRPALRDDYTDGLIKNVADTCNKTVVVLHNAGIRLVDQFVKHPNVTAIIFAHLPGQESGQALVSLLFGNVNFSGRLPYTVARNESDYGWLLGPSLPVGKHMKFPQSYFGEGLHIDYRHFDVQKKKPRYEFGFGMSYTSFNFSNLRIWRIPGPKTDEWPAGAISSGGQQDLWDPIMNVTADVVNTGHMAGAEVAQLYLGIPNAPERQLRGFSKVFLAPNDTTEAYFLLTRRDLSVWSPEVQKWQLQRGTYIVQVGNSSRSLPLGGTFTVREN